MHIYASTLLLPFLSAVGPSKSSTFSSFAKQTGLNQPFLFFTPLFTDIMILSNLLPVAATSLLFACSAFADKNYGEECTLTTCWASFNLECEEGPWYCSFNDSNSYPEFDRGDQHDPRLVIIDDDIEIEWRDQDKSHPVRVSWHWWAENDTDSTDELVGVRQLPSMKWDKSMFPLLRPSMSNSANRP